MAAKKVDQKAEQMVDQRVALKVAPLVAWTALTRVGRKVGAKE